MESDLWRGFVEVARAGSFTDAADRLPISQSGLSQQIRRLESLLQVPLFERSTRQVTLTDAGSRLLPLVIDLLDTEDAVLEAARAESGRTTPELLQILVPEDATGEVLIEVIDRIRAASPGVRVQVTQLAIAEQTNALLAASGCAALLERTPSPQPVGPGRRTSLRPEPLCVVMPEGEANPSSLTIDEAKQLQLRPMLWLPDHWLDWFPLLRGTGPHQDGTVLVVASFRAAIQSVPLDLRPCIAPVSIAEYMSGVGCTIVPLTDAPIASLDLVTRAEHPLLALLHNIASEVSEVSASRDTSSETAGEK